MNGLVDEFWSHVDRGELRVQWCEDCRRYQNHPRPLCTKCLGERLSFRPVTGRGRLYSWAIAVAEFGVELQGAAPYAFGVVELDDQAGLRLVAGLSLGERDRFAVGAPVDLVIAPVVRRDAAIVATLRSAS